MIDLVLLLVVLHDPQGGEVAINPAQITVMREAPRDRKQHFPASAACMLSTSDGKFLVVAETCATVRKLFDEAKRR